MFAHEKELIIYLLVTFSWMGSFYHMTILFPSSLKSVTAMMICSSLHCYSLTWRYKTTSAYNVHAAVGTGSIQPDVEIAHL